MSDWMIQNPLGPASDHSLQPVFRDDADRLRAQWGATFDYPDGYVGSAESRRRDRLVRDGRNLENIRSYTRGVHRGEQVDPASYVWPDEFNPMTGLALEARGQRFAPIGTTVAAYGDHRQAGMVDVDPETARRLAPLRPSWV